MLDSGFGWSGFEKHAAEQGELFNGNGNGDGGIRYGHGLLG